MAEGRLFYVRPEPLTSPPQAAVIMGRHRTESANCVRPGTGRPLRPGIPGRIGHKLDSTAVSVGRGTFKGRG